MTQALAGLMALQRRLCCRANQDMALMKTGIGGLEGFQMTGGLSGNPTDTSSEVREDI